MSILFLWLTRGGVLDYIAPHLRYLLVILPKYHYELPWLAENHPEQVALYTCLSFSLITFTVVKTLLFSIYIIFSRLSREIIVADLKRVVKADLASVLTFVSLIFLIPLPIYGAGASTTVVGNAYSLTFFNILFLKMLSGGISSTVLLAKRIKRPNRRDQVEVTSKD
ncbi:hypothetical protein ELI15_08940 [Rhizobium ruizarguesonis]|uniref:Uncharacterized protein n=2 Tax=Rhizobium ruizarguesonis TaxID=2081791 RepID=A0ABY1XGI5_9HYPH|nr:hypothetical protein ELI48_10195 [Rhizobium ruizarguesonis]TAU71373.1 hypothetical protein ELI45_08885 [Rhizobium ruizarguesonis]TAU79106.1 hypothetical protein ELI46_09105 [Rhizobium ruizarguesonis]TAV18541.1 hypothetical protein ELI34_09420 [Rhizobium ruizarguesonis]TAV30828.1 hypothetical protein ELI35_10735 [Rhizobium ruizarguesonis]